MEHKQIHVEVAAPKGMFKATFPDTTTVAAVIAAVVEKQSLPAGDKYELTYNGDSLAPTATLASLNVPEHVSFELVATGSGV